jgi:hypothetical protein
MQREALYPSTVIVPPASASTALSEAASNASSSDASSSAPVAILETETIFLGAFTQTKTVDTSPGSVMNSDVHCPSSSVAETSTSTPSEKVVVTTSPSDVDQPTISSGVAVCTTPSLHESVTSGETSETSLAETPQPIRTVVSPLESTTSPVEAVLTTALLPSPQAYVKATAPVSLSQVPPSSEVATPDVDTSSSSDARIPSHGALYTAVTPESDSTTATESTSNVLMTSAPNGQAASVSSPGVVDSATATAGSMSTISVSSDESGSSSPSTRPHQPSETEGTTAGMHSDTITLSEPNAVPVTDGHSPDRASPLGTYGLHEV